MAQNLQNAAQNRAHFGKRREAFTGGEARASGIEDVGDLVEIAPGLVQGHGGPAQGLGVDGRGATRARARCPEATGAEKSREAQTSIAGFQFNVGALVFKETDGYGRAALTRASLPLRFASGGGALSFAVMGAPPVSDAAMPREPEGVETGRVSARARSAPEGMQRGGPKARPLPS